MYTVRFADIGPSGAKVGAKAYHLSVLANHGLPVPDGFIVTMDAFVRTLEVHQLSLDHPEALADHLPTLTIPEDVRRELDSAFQPLLKEYGAVAVRSSSEAEDLEGASFAGQYETFLHIRDFQELQDQLKACWASIFAPSVLHYLKQMGMDTQTLPMGVIVQGLVRSEVSGVAFSTHPVTSDSREVMINASYGLGEAVVSGRVTPDLWTVKKDSHHIQVEPGSKEVQVYPDENGIKTVETPVQDRERLSLKDHQVLELARMTERVEELFGHSVDTEFAWEGDRLYLLQARPVTAGVTEEEAEPLSEFQRSLLLTESERKGDFWIFMEDHISEILSPLDASFLIPAFKGASGVFESFGFPSQLNTKVFKGRLYTSPSVPEEDQKIQMEKQKEKVAPLFPRLNQRLRDAVDQKLLPRYRRFEESARKTLSLQEASDQLRELFEFHKEVWWIHFDVVLPQGALHIALESVYKELLGEGSTVEIQELLTGKMNKFLEAERKMWKLAEQVKGNPDLLEVFSEGSAEDWWAALSDFPEGRLFRNRVKDFLSIYGYRPIRPHVFSETWIENPSHALASIASYVERTYDFDEEFRKSVERRKARVEEVFGRMPEGEKKQEFIRLHEWALDASCIRDDHHFYIDAMLPAVSRHFLLNVGQTLVRHRVLDEREEILYLYLDEVFDCLKNPEPMCDRVQKRKEAYEEYKKTSVPVFFGTPPEALKKDPMFEEMFGPIMKEEGSSDAIKGHAASKGTFTGAVKVIHDEKEFGKLQQGDVLVCKTTTPTWTILFSTAGAVVTDAGGVLSHSGIIAREYGVPAVLGTQAATRKLRDGDRVTVDGTHGTVTLLESSPHREAAAAMDRSGGDHS
ncbi:PEP/pyruvate-binding domain-containing protein [Paludifilum halophilum]|uniref:Phosphoenolpyruvate synthase n=1 Tax=Paludifilum halophilum TaxID=1642702 RepID=A0A235BB93_9BACL|nr:PEP/pyruvate-binding domain-containing protein [Paludifilum halophilum]OYD09578.1 hypothetical protein CHM34_00760 [Paludifilum halophilum]